MAHCEIIDVHMHCFVGREQAQTLAQDFRELRGQGVRHMVVAGLVNTTLDPATMWNLLPDFVENRGDSLCNEAEDLLELAWASEQMILPFIDTRHLWGDVEYVLKDYLRQGFKGIKGIYLPGDNNDLEELGVRGVPETFGITLEQYRRREWEIFSFAQSHELPLLYHMDARRYGDDMKALLDDFPEVRVDFAHLGIGRKAFGPILDRYPNVFTDLAGLLPHLRNNPASYRDFILHYPDRVCFGTDAMLYNTKSVLAYIDVVRELKLPEEIEYQLFTANPARFLGSTLGAEAASGLASTWNFS
jgi:hypothetical protein